MTQITSEDDSNISSRRYNRVKMYVVYEADSCNILTLKEQLIFNNKNRAYIIQTK